MKITLFSVSFPCVHILSALLLDTNNVTTTTTTIMEQLNVLCTAADKYSQNNNEKL